MPRYQFVTNLYQAFGLSFISRAQPGRAGDAILSAVGAVDRRTSPRRGRLREVAELVEQNNRVQQLLTGVAFYLWTDGKIGGYVRYVADGAAIRFAR